mmetsp:Transcript_5555/g.6286  ORF Transcript_5555/g.6286 Transcript_5555/m.6286 type:complete len:128 (-) Transcript_5555:35-418(-)
MIRGGNNLVAVIFDIDFTLRLEWLDNDSVYIAFLAGFYYIIVDIIPSVYLSMGIRIITQEYLEKQRAHTSVLATTSASIFTEREDSFIDNNWEAVENSNETYNRTTLSSNKNTGQDELENTVNTINY